jgi:tetratricopeptide (TPR) repeat protein
VRGTKYTYTQFDMPVPLRLACLVLVLPLAACVALAEPPERESAVDAAEAAHAQAEPPSPAHDAKRLPAQELTEPLLYELLLAEIALQRGDAALAAKTYLELAKRTRDPRVARRAAEVASLARAPDLALEAARVWHEAEPESVQALQTLTALLVRARKVEEAEPYLATLLSRDGAATANGFLQLGRLLAGNPDKQANLRLVQRLAARHPQMAQAQLAVAQAALAAEDEAQALAQTRRARALQPDWEMAAIYEAQILQRKDPAAAAQSLAAFLEGQPKARDARLAYARLLVGERRLAEARAQFEALLAAFPDNGEVRYAVGLLAMQLRDFATAESVFKRLLDAGFRDPSGVRYLLGQAAEEQRKWTEALDWYGSIERGENALPARLRTAGVLAKQGRLEEARAYLRKVEASEEQRVQLLVTEAHILREANQHLEAYELLDRALVQQPEQPELLYDHALTAEKLERFDVLEASLRKLIRLKPDHAHAYNALGYSFADRNLRLPEARKLIERALELMPEDYYIIDSMGWVLYRMGDLKGALEHLRRAYLGRPDAEIGAHLGEVLWKLGRRDEAGRIWDEALKQFPENETLRKTLKRLRP